MKFKVFALAACVLCACRDEGRSQYSKARAQYEALIAKGTLPSAPEFEEVIKALDAVPEGSSAKGDARALSTSLSRARGPKVVRPLSPQNSVCAALAEKLGPAQGEERARLARQVSECRAKEQAAAEAEHHR